MINLPLTMGFYRSDSAAVSNRELSNWYVNVTDDQEVLFGTPGIVQIATTGTSHQENRGSNTMAGLHYFVNGDALYRLNTDYTVDELGDIEGDVTLVSMANNGTQLMILVPGGKGYIFTEDPDTLTEITAAGFRDTGNPQYVTFIDSYFAVTDDGGKWRISNANDGLTWDAVDVGSAESSPDKTVAPFVLNNKLWIGGGETLEQFENIGGADFPFQRTGLFIDKGIFAPSSIVESSGAIMFIGGGVNEAPVIWALSGNNVSPISDPSIDALLGDLTADELTQVYGFSYSQRGEYFTGWKLPSVTIVYGARSQRWHTRSSFIGGQDVGWRVQSIGTAYDKIIVCDDTDGRIGYLDLDEYQEYGSEIRRIVSTPKLENEGKSFGLPALRATVESGVGNDVVADPQMWMDISKDGGKTWNQSRLQTLGKKGEYQKLVYWTLCGHTKRHMIIRLIMSDAVKPVLVKLEADIAGGYR